MVALDKRVILIALHAREGVVHVAVACLVSSHVQDEISHASILQPDSTLKTRPCNCTLVQALDAMQFYDCILRKQPASKCVRPLSSTMIDHAASKVLRGTCSIELSAQPHLISKGHKVCRSAWCNGPREGGGHAPCPFSNTPWQCQGPSCPPSQADGPRRSPQCSACLRSNWRTQLSTLSWDMRLTPTTQSTPE